MVRQNGEETGTVTTPVGICAVCRVSFAASPAEAPLVRELLRVHQMVCPGGDRMGETVMPIAPNGTSDDA